MEKIALRNIEKKDWDYILDLRNSSFEFFYKQNVPIEKNEHYNYMKNQSINPKFYHWIIIMDNEDVGYVRILENDVGIMIDKKYQNLGIGSIALQLIETKAKKYGITKLVALINKDNEKSKKMFENNGYNLNLLWLEKQIL